jgi:hypothetical protein
MGDEKKTEKNGPRDELVLPFLPLFQRPVYGDNQYCHCMTQYQESLPVLGVKESGRGWIQDPRERLQTGEFPSRNGNFCFCGHLDATDISKE